MSDSLRSPPGHGNCLTLLLPPSIVSETSDGVPNDVENEGSGVTCACCSPASVLVPGWGAPPFGAGAS